MELDRPAALDDLRHCVSHVRNLGATATGVVGFCMGGSLAWQLAYGRPAGRCDPLLRFV
jgi:dienelactone hydrolase